ncbi:MAG: acetyl-CoA carboxylase biotin carboxyl carrier protein subunit [Proteobacteria bacterium]|nr:acetyl-CoA carboxylase biotin carboxyl carrier protein subunit [Pseudomonadota bacterium]
MTSAMTPDDIARLAGWLRDSGIGLLELRGPGTALRLRQGAGGITAETIAPAELEAHAQAHDEAHAEPHAEAQPEAPLIVSAPSVGVFLHRHPLRADDLAAPGTAVAAGQVLGLLQIGPLLLPVAAPAAALLQDRLAPHGAAVGYGTPLAALQPIDPN